VAWKDRMECWPNRLARTRQELTQSKPRIHENGVGVRKAELPRRATSRLEREWSLQGDLNLVGGDDMAHCDGDLKSVNS
jgi:hypothetical protein